MALRWSRLLRSAGLVALGAAVTLVSSAVWAQHSRSDAQMITVAAASFRPADDPPTPSSFRPADDPPTPSSAPSSVAPRDGMYEVGVDLLPGTYVTRSTSEVCYFTVASDLSESLTSVLKTYFGDAFGRRVVLEPGQYFETDECGVWTRQAPSERDVAP